MARKNKVFSCHCTHLCVYLHVFNLVPKPVRGCLVNRHVMV